MMNNPCLCLGLFIYCSCCYPIFFYQCVVVCSKFFAFVAELEYSAQLDGFEQALYKFVVFAKAVKRDKAWVDKDADNAGWDSGDIAVEDEDESWDTRIEDSRGTDMDKTANVAQMLGY